MDMYINGYRPKDKGGVNVPSDLDTIDSRGGFFNEVFGATSLTRRMYVGNYSEFSNLIKYQLKDGKMLGITHQILGRRDAAHVVTVWGAEFDINGNISALYITDSDDQNEGADVGMRCVGIVAGTDNIPRMNTATGSNTVAWVEYLYTLDAGKEGWDNYLSR